MIRYCREAITPDQNSILENLREKRAPGALAKAFYECKKFKNIQQAVKNLSRRSSYTAADFEMTSRSRLPETKQIVRGHLLKETMGKMDKFGRPAHTLPDN